MAETKKYVRILKAPYRSIWYANQIGSVFPSLGTWENTYKVDSPDRALYICQEDAELIVTEKRQAKVGERVLITDKYGTYGEYKNGDILTADLCMGYAITTKEVDLTFIFHSEYEVIVNNEVKNEEADEVENIEKRYDIAVETARDAIEEMRAAAYAKGYEDARRALMATAPVEKTAQERRDEIVEQAKADIENLKYRTFYGELRYSYHSIVCNVEFVVNKEKRTVVALLKSVGRGTVKSKGIAKAAPNDCFNEHIGKTIALHRALGLEVPDEYLNAPNPTEVRVGDVVAYRGVYKTIDYATVVDDGEPTGAGRAALTSIAVKRAKIIDDSRTEVGE
ncbi:hypothetical protein P4U97_21485 [Bacillus swezeyi]|uniref:hypothetical protein n=1 Tax=Bacillus swezeyi TaxID=1925020 RepID=UPI002E1E5C1B|nr:hypothetical protein [Bacillus swezeyi]